MPPFIGNGLTEDTRAQLLKNIPPPPSLSELAFPLLSGGIPPFMKVITLKREILIQFMILG